MEPTAEQIALAERVSEDLRDRYPQQVQAMHDAALAAIMETQEACAKVADNLGGVRGPHDAVSPSNRAQHVRARTIATAIRLGAWRDA